jgi:hypothetical protein
MQHANSVAAAQAQRIAAGARRALRMTAVVGSGWWVVAVDAGLTIERETRPASSYPDAPDSG